jgi:hypothetical protein
LKPGSYKADLIDGKKYDDNVYKCILNIGGEIPQDEGFFKFCSDVLSKIDISKSSKENYDKIYLSYYNDYIQKGFSPEEAHKLAEENALLTLKKAQDIGYLAGDTAAGKLSKLIPKVPPTKIPIGELPSGKSPDIDTPGQVPREVDAIPVCEPELSTINIPTLKPASGRDMLHESLEHLKRSPPEDRIPIFDEHIKQINSKTTGGDWKAEKADIPGGGAMYKGEGGEVLIIDSNGDMFKGNLAKGAKLEYGPGGTVKPGSGFKQVK